MTGIANVRRAILGSQKILYSIVVTLSEVVEPDLGEARDHSLSSFPNADLPIMCVTDRTSHLRENVLDLASESVPSLLLLSPIFGDATSLQTRMPRASPGSEWDTKTVVFLRPRYESSSHWDELISSAMHNQSSILSLLP